MELSKEAKEIIWGPVNKLKKKYSRELDKEKKSIRIQSARKILNSLVKDNLIAGEEDKEIISCLLLCGAFQFGCFEKSKERQNLCKFQWRMRWA